MKRVLKDVLSRQQLIEYKAKADGEIKELEIMMECVDDGLNLLDENNSLENRLQEVLDEAFTNLKFENPAVRYLFEPKKIEIENAINSDTFTSETRDCVLEEEYLTPAVSLLGELEVFIGEHIETKDEKEAQTAVLFISIYGTLAFMRVEHIRKRVSLYAAFTENPVPVKVKKSLELVEKQRTECNSLMKPY